MNTETESITHSYFSPKWHFKYLWKSHFLFFIVTTCPQKCNFRTSDLYAFGDPLGKIDLTIGDKKKILNFCLGFSFNKININCSSWKASKSHTVYQVSSSCIQFLLCSRRFPNQGKQISVNLNQSVVLLIEFFLSL